MGPRRAQPPSAAIPRHGRGHRPRTMAFFLPKRRTDAVASAIHSGSAMLARRSRGRRSSPGVGDDHPVMILPTFHGWPRLHDGASRAHQAHAWRHGFNLGELPVRCEARAGRAAWSPGRTAWRLGAAANRNRRDPWSLQTMAQSGMLDACHRTTGSADGPATSDRPARTKVFVLPMMGKTRFNGGMRRPGRRTAVPVPQPSRSPACSTGCSAASPRTAPTASRPNRMMRSPTSRACAIERCPCSRR